MTERRRHRALVTRNSEYHLRDGICVAVKERQTGRFCQRHPAIGMRLVLVSAEEGHGDPALPVGGRAYFLDEGQRNLLTSTVETVVRPAREAVANYVMIEGHA